MIEPEMAFCDLQADMDNAEGFVKYVVQHVLDNCQEARYGAAAAWCSCSMV
jgi:asparaginyl-tRNA synthetase